MLHRIQAPDSDAWVQELQEDFAFSLHQIDDLSAKLELSTPAPASDHESDAPMQQLREPQGEPHLLTQASPSRHEHQLVGDPQDEPQPLPQAPPSHQASPPHQVHQSGDLQSNPELLTQPLPSHHENASSMQQVATEQSHGAPSIPTEAAPLQHGSTADVHGHQDRQLSDAAPDHQQRHDEWPSLPQPSLPLGSSDASVPERNTHAPVQVNAWSSCCKDATDQSCHTSSQV